MDILSMSIEVRGSTKQIAALLKAILPGGHVEEFIRTKGLQLNLRTEAEKADIQDSNYYPVFEKISWETFFLGHLIIAHQEGGDSRGIYVTLDTLLSLPLSKKHALFEKNISSRVGGAKRVTKHFNLDAMLSLSNAKSTKTRRVYLSFKCIDQFKEYLKDFDAEYREWLADEGISYPGISA